MYVAFNKMYEDEQFQEVNLVYILSFLSTFNIIIFSVLSLHTSDSDVKSFRFILHIRIYFFQKIKMAHGQCISLDKFVFVYT